MLSALRSFCAPARRRTRRRVPYLECLEAREVPAIQIDFSTLPVLTINADTNGVNSVTVTREDLGGILGQKVFLRNNGGQQIFSFRPDQVSSIVFNGSVNADTFRNSTVLPSTIFGNGGNDVLIGGGGLDIISGGPGNDIIDGGDSLFPNVVTETADANFTLTDPTPAHPGVATMTGLGSDQLVNIRNVRLTGGAGNNTFDLTGYSGSAFLSGSGGDDTFRLGSGLVNVDGGADGLLGDAIVMDGISTALVEQDTLFARGTADTFQNVERLVLTGTAGNDTFDLAGSSARATINGLAGDDIIRGSAGSDIIDAGPGNNIILPSTGNDLISPGNNFLAGIVSGRLTPDQLSATTGPLRAIFRNIPGQQALDVFGPTGAGFTLEGTWTRTVTSTAEVFSVSSNVVLKTSLGDLQLGVLSSPIQFETVLDPVANFGVVTKVTWNGPPLTTGLANSPLAALSSQYGLDLSVPSGSWGLALGRDVPGGSGMPINPAVPYLYLTVSSGYSASFAGRTAGVGGLTVVFDPSDPSLFLRAAGLEVAVSAKGYIPFRQQQPLNGAAPVIFGNLATAASINLGGGSVVARGDLVLDRDANDDGIGISITPDRIRGLITNQLSVTDFAGAGLSDVSLGVNGTVLVSPVSGGIDFPVDMATASLVGASGQVRFAGNGVPAAPGTPLALFVAGTLSVQGTGTLSAGATSATVTGRLAGDLGTFLPGLATLQADSGGDNLSGSTCNVIGFGSFAMSGPVTKNATTGAVEYGLTGSPSINIDVVRTDSLNLPTGPIVLDRALMQGNAVLSNKNLSGTVVFDVEVFATIVLDLPLTFKGHLAGTLFVHSSAGGGVTFGWTGNIAGQVSTLGGLFSDGVLDPVLLSNNQFTATLDLFPTIAITIPLNSAPAFKDRAITPRAAVGALVTLTGRIAQADPADAFILQVNWGDGTSDTYTFPPGSDGRLVAVTHRYRRPNPAGQPYRVTVSWHGTHEAGSSAEFTVEVRDPEPASGEALRLARKLGQACKVRADLDGDGVAEVLALQQTGRGRRLIVLSGRTAKVIARVRLRHAHRTLTLRGPDGVEVALVVSWRHRRGQEVIALRDPHEGEPLLRVAFDHRDRR